MKNLQQQLIDNGFEPDFKPEITSNFINHYVHGKGRGGYVYTEYPHQKGVLKVFTYHIWKELHSVTLKEYPEGSNAKEKKELEETLKQSSITFKQLSDAKHQVATLEAKEKIAKCVVATELPEYLVSKDLSIFKGYLVSLDVSDSVDRMIIPMYGKNKEIVSYETISAAGDKDFQSGGKSEGSYGILEGEGDTLYICEGYATAASIHLATGSTVCFVRGCHNYIPALKNITGCFKYEYLVIAADNDKHIPINAGFIKAQEAADKFNAIVKIPVFYKYDGKNTTDWDDIRRLEGMPKVLEGLGLSDTDKKVLEDKPGITPLGYRGKSYYFMSSQKQTIEELTAFDKQALFGIIKKEYWFKRYGQQSKNGLVVDWDEVVSELKESCHYVGVYSESNHRGIGFHFDKDQLVINTGKDLIVDGKHIPTRSFKSKYNYIVKDETKPLHDKPLTDEELALFIASFDKITLKQKTQKEYIFGWMVCSIISGLIDWRPHIYITGSQGSGKTEITDFVNKILSMGWKTLYTKGTTTTPTGFRQKVASNAIPVFIDEVEGVDKNTSQKAAGYISLARSASSNSEAIDLLGSQTQNPIEYKVGFCCWLAGVTPQIKLAQDKTRFVVIDTVRNENGNKKDWDEVSKYWEDLDEEWARRFIARIVQNIPIILSNIKAAVNSVAECGSNRYADQHGTLLGAALILRHTNLASRDELEDIKNNSLAAEAVASEKEDRVDERECLDHILDARIKYEMEIPTVRDLLTRETTFTPEGKSIRMALGDFGVAIKENKGKNGIHIRATNELNKHMREKPQFEANYVKILSRVKGSEAQTVLTFRKSNFRGTWIPRELFDDGSTEKLDDVQF